MTLVDWTCVVLMLHFVRLLLRAVFLARHQAYDSSDVDIARGLNYVKTEERTQPKNGNPSSTKTETKTFEVPDTDRVTWRTRQRVFWAQFLVN